MNIWRNKKFIAITLAISQAMIPISYVLSLSDIMTRTIVKDIEIDNQPPLADLGAIQKKKVDIVFTTDRNIIGLNEKIDQFVKATINAKGGDVLDTSIATVETTTVSTNDGDAKKIFDSWQSFPQVNSWGYDSVNKVVYNNDNPPWETGFYDPTKFESKDFKMESDIYSNQPSQPIGLMFKLHPSLTYADRYNMYYWWASGSHAVLFKVENAKINDPRNNWSGTYSSTPLLSFLTNVSTPLSVRNYELGTSSFSGSYGGSTGLYATKSDGGYYQNRSVGGVPTPFYINAKGRYIDLGKDVPVSDIDGISFHTSSDIPVGATFQVSVDGNLWSTLISGSTQGNFYVNASDTTMVQYGNLYNKIRYIRGVSATRIDDFTATVNLKPKYEYKLGWPAHAPYDYGGFPHMTPMQKGVQVSNLADPIMKTTVMDFVPVNHTQGWHKMAVQMDGNKIKSTFDSEVIETIDSSPYEKGSMGFFQYSHVGPLFKNIMVESSNTKTLDEALKTHTWRDGSYRFVVNIDEKLKSLGYSAGNFNQVSYMKILSKLINDKIGYIGITNKSLKGPTKKVIADNNEYGYYADINSEFNEFNFTGSPQEVSLAPGKYKFEAWGANGGRSIRYSNLPGGRGGYTSAILDLKEETNFNVYVGGVGGGGGLNGDAINDIGGYNGGGSLAPGESAYGAPGGGATDFRLKGGNWYDFDSLTSRILVAGGGGGANSRDGDNPTIQPLFTSGYGRGKGGDGGGATAAYGLTENQDTFGLNFGYAFGSGGSQSMGGITHYYRNGVKVDEITTGIFGGGHTNLVYSQSGGGGGYYGGASSIHGGGGGGSSFVTGASSCDLTYRYLHKNLAFSSVVMETGDASNPAVIDARNGNGYAKITKVVGEATGLDAALLNSANYIISEINKSTVANSKYIILNSDLKYDITYSDYENDIPMNLNDFNFRYNHDETYFENNLGRISNNNQWISSLINTFTKNTEAGSEHQWLSGSVKYFDKVGKYLVEYRTKDDPIPGEDNFSEYRKYSSMPSGPLELYVHRKPLAEAKFKITKTNPTMTVNFTSLAYDLDHESLANKGIMAKEWWYKQIGTTSWINGGTADTFSFVGNMTTDYIVKHRVQDIDGELGIGVWNEKEYIVTSKSLPPVASFTINPTTYPIRSELSITDANYDPNGDTIIEEVWKLYDPSGTLRYQKVLSNPTGVTQAQVNVVSTEVKNMIDIQGHAAYGKWTLTQQLRDSSGSWLDALAVSDLISKTITVIPNNGAPSINISPLDVLIDGINMSDIDNAANPLNRFITWGLNATDPDIDNKGFTYRWELEHREDKEGRVIKSIANKNATDKIRTYNYNSITPFENKSFKEQNLPPGPYLVTANIIDIPTYGEPSSASITKRFYVVPTMSGISQIIHDKSEVICGDTVKLRVNTDYITEKVVVEVLGTTLELVKVSETGNNAVWELDYTIPELDDTQDVNFKFTLTTFFGSQDIYGNGSTPTRTKTINQTINVVALKLEDFRITEMVNHDFFSYSYPIFKDKMPVDYIAGYYVTLQVDAKGNPEKVISKVSTDGGTTSTNLEFKLVGHSGTKGIWEAKYFLDNKSAIGTIVSNDITAYKNTTSYNYNTKEAWDGETLKVVSGLEKDIVIKRTN